MALLTLIQNNTKPRVNFVIKDASLNPVNITGCTIVFNLYPVGGSVRKFQGVCVIDTPLSGACHYDWALTDLDTAGAYHGDLSITFPAGEKQGTNLMGFDIRPTL
jgi:hypothetical protein